MLCPLATIFFKHFPSIVLLCTVNPLQRWMNDSRGRKGGVSQYYSPSRGNTEAGTN